MLFFNLDVTKWGPNEGYTPTRLTFFPKTAEFFPPKRLTFSNFRETKKKKKTKKKQRNQQIIIIYFTNIAPSRLDLLLDPELRGRSTGFSLFLG